MFAVVFGASFFSLIALTLGGGASFEPCIPEVGCAPNRTCIAITVESLAKLGSVISEQTFVPIICRGSEYCVCLPERIITCPDDSVCEKGEECLFDGIGICVAKQQKEALMDIQMCSSTSDCRVSQECSGAKIPGVGSVCLAGRPKPEAVDTNSSNSSAVGSPMASVSNSSSATGVCIGVKSIRHLSSKQLLYEKHLLAHVLCDGFESCATPGHIVTYKGRSMMMKTYCETAGCEATRMLVNSPKYRRGLNIRSETPGLWFTVHAARYESKLEEHVLRAAIGVGL